MEWISVDRKPEKSGEYLAVIRNGSTEYWRTISVMYFNHKDNDWLYLRSDFFNPEVLFWQELPKIPQKESKNEKF